MKIVQLLPLIDGEGRFGGPVSVAATQASTLRQMGHDVELWAPARAPHPEVRTFRAMLTSRFSLLVSPGLLLAVGRTRADVVHLHAGRHLTMLLAALLLRARKRPYVVQTHGMVPRAASPALRLYDMLLTRPALRGAASVFTLTPQDDADVAAQGVHRQVRMRNAVRPGPTYVVSQEDRDIRVLFVSRLHPRKRVLDLINAVAALVDRGHAVSLDVVGPDEGDLANVRQRARELDAGWLAIQAPWPYDEVRSRMSDFDVFCLPSVDEPFPMVLLEALATGLPSICTTSCGIADELALRDAAVVTQPGSLALEAALARMVSDRELRSRLSRAAQQAVAELYSCDALGASLQQQYTAAVAREAFP